MHAYVQREALFDRRNENTSHDQADLDVCKRTKLTIICNERSESRQNNNNNNTKKRHSQQQTTTPNKLYTMGCWWWTRKWNGDKSVACSSCRPPWMSFAALSQLSDAIFVQFSTEIIFCLRFLIFVLTYHPVSISFSSHICGGWVKFRRNRCTMQASAAFENSAQNPAVFKPTKCTALRQS